MSEPPNPKYAFHPTTRTLNIFCLKSLGAVVSELKSDSFPLPKQIHSINILQDGTIEDEYDDKYGDDRFLEEQEKEERDSKTSLEISQHVGTIIDLIQAGNGLEEFAWEENLFHKPRTSPFFWNALWRTSQTLEKLSLVFNSLEVHKLVSLPGPPQKFTRLKTLQVDARQSHGCNGTFLFKILHASSALEDLNLSFPNCDLETCRLQNIAWDFYFPSLSSFTFHGYTPDNKTFSSFISKHPGIKSLAWEVWSGSADEEFVFEAHWLPNIEALCIGFEHTTKNTAILGKDTLRHLRIAECPSQYYPVVLTAAKGVKCLELIMRTSWREGSREARTAREAERETEGGQSKNDLEGAKQVGNEGTTQEIVEEVEYPVLQEIIGESLKVFDNLRELSLDLETSYTSYMTSYSGECIWTKAEPMGIDDLRSVLDILPPNTFIRALRLSDLRGLSLPDEILEDATALNIPENLKYLGWNTADKILYRVEREDGRVRLVKSEPVRVLGPETLWTEERILDY